MPMDAGLSVAVHGLCTYKVESTIAGAEDLSVNKLGNDVSECLKIQDDRDGVPGSKPPCGKYEFLKKDGATKKYFSEGTMFPCSSTSTSTSTSTSSALASIEVALGMDAITAKESTPLHDIKSADPRCSHSPSLPAAIKPVSAMKGSREKRGVTPPQKLTVKWAPDVYDPVPTSVSHAVTNNKPQTQRHSKKNSKSKQKNGSKSSRGNKYKDKKQGRKRGGNSSNVGFKFPEHEEEEVVVDYCEPPPTAMDFHVGNPDQFCGSSFLKRYGRNLHLSSLAEAT